MPLIDKHAAVVLASSFSFSKLSVEDYVIGIAVLMAILLLIVRSYRGHNLKRRRAASSGFYDFDVAHYGNSSLIEKTAAGPTSLAPSFVAPGRDGQKAKTVTGVTTGPRPLSLMPTGRSPFRCPPSTRPKPSTIARRTRFLQWQPVSTCRSPPHRLFPACPRTGTTRPRPRRRRSPS